MQKKNYVNTIYFSLRIRFVRKTKLNKPHLLYCLFNEKKNDVLIILDKFYIFYKSSFERPPANCTFSPGLKAGIPKYGHVAQRNASPK